MEFLWNILASLLFSAAFAALVLRWLASGGVNLPAPWSEPLPDRCRGRVSAASLARVFIIGLAFRIVYAFVTLFLFQLISGTQIGLGGLPELWCRWDAPHYVHLTELGYGGYLDDGQPLFLVFYPLYVWLTRAVSLLIPNIPLAGLAVSWICFAGGCTYFYALGVEEYGEKLARGGLLVLVSFPFAFFFGGIMTESLFFLTTAAGLYHIRRHQWLAAGLWGVAAALTRMQGVLLAGAAVAELVNQQRPFDQIGSDRRRAYLNIMTKLPVLFLPFLGSLAYFGLNFYITGDPFAFTRMQAHWSQGFRWFPEVLAYLANNALTWSPVSTRWEMWIPELLLFPVFVLLICRSWKRHRSMFVLYSTVYFILNYCLNWLLSAGRYLSCALPCAFFAADWLEDRPRWRIVLILVMWVLQMIFLIRYFSWGQVM